MYVDTVVSGKDTSRHPNFATAKEAAAYLPAGAGWYDFWTGEKLQGGQTVRKTTPIDIIPIFAKAGSILPIGPKVQFATQKRWDELEIRVYAGADGKATLYEDENDNYSYEQGANSTIEFKWDDAKKVLTIGDRTGSFPGMREVRKFNIVWVSKDKGVGVAPVEAYDSIITYSGRAVEVKP